MIIDVNNGKIINSKEVYLHDDFLDDMRFNFLEKNYIFLFCILEIGVIVIRLIF